MTSMATNTAIEGCNSADKHGGEDSAIPQLDPEDIKAIEDWVKKDSCLKIMVTGETGAGKSTILNAIIGQKVFKTDDEDKQRVTTEVSEYRYYDNKLKIEIIAIDCPGLHDGTHNEDKYIQQMKAMIDKYEGLDLLLYCQDINETRADFEKKIDMIARLTHGLGREIWKHALFVLTHANVYEKQLKERFPCADSRNAEFKKKKEEWKKVIEDVMTECNIECNVKVCAAGSRSPKLFNHEYWLSDLWAAAIEVLDENAALALLRFNQFRMIDPLKAVLKPEHFKADIDEQPIVMTSAVLKALGIAGATGGTGAAIGAAVGATIGGVVSLGPAAGAGYLIGGYVGAVVGSSIGGAILVLYNRRKAKEAII